MSDRYNAEGLSSKGEGPGSGPNPMLIMRQAFKLHQQGRLDEAERLYRDVLLHIPAHPDALHFLGVIEVQRGRHDAGIRLMDQALAANPRNVAALYNRANALRDLGQLTEALAGYNAALAVKPDNIAALNNRGAVLHALERHEEAVASYDRAIACKSDSADAHANRGNVLVELDRPEEALLSFDRALGLLPEHVPALYGRGNALAKLKRFDEAAAAYDRALVLAPGNAELLNNRGNVLCQLCRFQGALETFNRVIAATPNDASALGNRGNVFMQLRRYEEALADYNRALQLNMGYADALYGRGSALVELKRHDEAIAAFSQLLLKRPDYAYAPGMLVYAQMTCCDWSDGSTAAALIESIRAGKRAATPLVLLALSDSPDDKLRCSQILVRDKYGAAVESLWRGEKYRHDRIRLAYVSADFRAHPVSVQLAGVFENHDRTRFETIAISHGLNDASAMRARLMRGADRFLDVQGQSDREVALGLREMEADIVIDLTGFTAGGRPGIMLFRPSPVQVNYLGFAGSMGSDHFDYLLADEVVVPQEQMVHYTEKLAFLPGSFMPHDATRRIAERTPSRAEQRLPEHGFVFASFNNTYKFSKHTFDTWMRLLARVEGSVLWLPAAGAAAVRNLRREAEARGIAADRIIFANYVTAPEDHLARLRLADLFLDTLPYNAHSSACDALWAGLPVLTCRGGSFAGRVGASLLHAAGLPELIMGTFAAYEERALYLAQNPASLAEVRAKLWRNRATCALFDTARFTKNLEAAYTTMWERAMGGLPPATFVVSEAVAAEAS